MVAMDHGDGMVKRKKAVPFAVKLVQGSLSLALPSDSQCRWLLQSAFALFLPACLAWIASPFSHRRRQRRRGGSRRVSRLTSENRDQGGPTTRT